LGEIEIERVREFEMERLREFEMERLREFEMERLRDEEMERCVGVVITRRPWSFLIQALPRWF